MAHIGRRPRVAPLYSRCTALVFRLYVRYTSITRPVFFLPSHALALAPYAMLQGALKPIVFPYLFCRPEQTERGDGMNAQPVPIVWFETNAVNFSEQA